MFYIGSVLVLLYSINPPYSLKCTSFITWASSLLKPNGRLLTLDGCYIPNQNKMLLPGLEPTISKSITSRLPAGLHRRGAQAALELCRDGAGAELLGAPPGLARALGMGALFVVVVRLLDQDGDDGVACLPVGGNKEPVAV